MKDLESLCGVTGRLREYLDKENYDPELDCMVDDFIRYTDENFQVVYCYFLLGTIDEKEEIKGSYLEKNKQLEIVDYHDLTEKVADHLSKLSRENIDWFKVHLSANSSQATSSFVKAKIGKHHTFVSIISGDEVVRLRDQFRFKLYDSNVRYFLKESEINSGIVKTALHEKEAFYFFNNGLTLTTSRFKIQNDKGLMLYDPQVINGGQTIDSIYKAFKESVATYEKKGLSFEEARKKAFKEFQKINILFRVIQTEKKNNGINQFENRVVRFNNTQNSISQEDLITNNPEQIELQRLLSDYGYFYELKIQERRSISRYPHRKLNKRLEDFTFKEEEVRLRDLIQIQSAFHQFPSKEDFKKAVTETKRYERLFGIEKIPMDDWRVQNIILAYNLHTLIVKEVEKLKDIRKNITTVRNTQKIKEKLTQANKCYFFEANLRRNLLPSDPALEQLDSLIPVANSIKYVVGGEFFLLAILSRIIDFTGYADLLIKKEVVTNKSLLHQAVIQPWLASATLRFLIRAIEKKRYSKKNYHSFYNQAINYEEISRLLEEDASGVDRKVHFQNLFPLDLSSTQKEVIPTSSSTPPESPLHPVKKAISLNNFEKAFYGLQKLDVNGERKDNILLLEGRWRNLNEQKTQNTIAQEYYGIEMSKIRKALLQETSLLLKNNTPATTEK